VIGAGQEGIMIARYLDPQDASAEILFGLIMALTFTLGATLVAEGEVARLREIVYGAVTCNLAWGLIDGFFYILADLFEISRRGMRITEVQRARSKTEAMEAIREAFEERITGAATPEEREHFYEEVHRLVSHMTAPARRPTRDSVAGAGIIFLLVSATSLPVVLPSLLLEDIAIALQISNGLLVICLFATGYWMATTVKGRPIRFGAITAAIGLVLVGVAKALGG
jgi:VIT1/CCC1 family predicted Fe2+/Mn2+ transporter